jgi:hypothetical protein
MQTFTPSTERLEFLKRFQHQVAEFSKDRAAQANKAYWDGMQHAVSMILKVEQTGNPSEVT